MYLEGISLTNSKCLNLRYTLKEAAGILGFSDTSTYRCSNQLHCYMTTIMVIKVFPNVTQGDSLLGSRSCLYKELQWCNSQDIFKALNGNFYLLRQCRTLYKKCHFMPFITNYDVLNLCRNSLIATVSSSIDRENRRDNKGGTLNRGHLKEITWRTVASPALIFPQYILLIFLDL